MTKSAWLFIGIMTRVLTSTAAPVEVMYSGSFGNVTLYQPANAPDALVIFVSGDGGWNAGVVEMAKNIVAQGAMVAGIDIRHYYKIIKSRDVKCHYPASDFEDLSMTIQKKHKFPRYLKPILVGYSSGATLVYGILAQAPANTFKGAISMGFCPDIETDRTLCHGSGLTTHVLKEGRAYYLEPCRHLSAPFIVLQGMTDQVCSFEETKKYMDGLPDGELVALPKVGHGFSVARNWLPRFIEAYREILQSSGYVDKINAQNRLLQSQHLVPLPDVLPLTLIPTSLKENLPLVFFISGDGGWTNFDQEVCEKLAEKGMPVAGLDAQKYFWNPKLPKDASEDISRAIRHYMQQWNRNSFVLVGYSFGACVAPFIADNFSADLKESLKGVYCYSPDMTGDFEIHISDLLNIGNNEKYDVLTELKKIAPLNPVCIFGSEEDINLRNHFSSAGIKLATLSGNHHYDNNFNAMAGIIYHDLPGAINR